MGERRGVNVWGRWLVFFLLWESDCVCEMGEID